MIESLYPLALSVHIGTVFVLIAIIVATDLYGLSWILGKKETLNPKPIKLAHNAIWLGLGIMIISGLILFWPLQSYLLFLPTFYIKMTFIVALIVNGAFIGRHMHIPAERPFRELSAREKKALVISGAVSTFSWVGAITAANFLT